MTTMSVVGECFFWYRLTRVVPDKFYRAVKRLCVCVWILSRTTRVSQYQKKHSPTHNYHCHQSSLICFLHLLRSMASSCSIYVPEIHFPQSLLKYSLVYLLAWHPPLHTLRISSPNHCLLFAAHSHTFATCFAVVPRLCQLILVSLSNLYLELYLVA